jgi:hypothetical protein
MGGARVRLSVQSRHPCTLVIYVQGSPVQRLAPEDLGDKRASVAVVTSPSSGRQSYDRLKVLVERGHPLLRLGGERGDRRVGDSALAEKREEPVRPRSRGRKAAVAPSTSTTSSQIGQVCSEHGLIQLLNALSA